MIRLSKLVAVLVLAVAAHTATADVQFNLDNNFGGSTLTSPPWVSATFSQSAGDVVLTLTTTLGSPDYVSKFFFNFAGVVLIIEIRKIS